MRPSTRFFVLLKQRPGLLWFPVPVQPWVSAVVSISAILAVFPMIFARHDRAGAEGAGRIQNRPGPNRVGPPGSFQFAADGIKSLTKGGHRPARCGCGRPLPRAVGGRRSRLCWPAGGSGRWDATWGDWIFPRRAFCFLMVGTAVELGVFMAGWSQPQNILLLGAMRALAQLLSYELPCSPTVSVILLTGSLSLAAVIAKQAEVVRASSSGWNVFTPWERPARIWVIAALAE